MVGFSGDDGSEDEEVDLRRRMQEQKELLDEDELSEEEIKKQLA